jgi:polygalacturonase
MKTWREFRIASLSAVAIRAFAFSTLLGILLIASASRAAQERTPQPPVAIGPIKAPFEMPQLKRPSFPDRAFDIRDYGAVLCQWGQDDKRKSTAAIQKAIEACHQAGGGRVLIPKGDWLTGAIHLRSNVNLHVAEGAVVHFSNDLEDYLPLVHVRCEGVEAYNYSPLIYAPQAQNIAITGRGTLHGHGRWWWRWARNNDRGNRIEAAKVPLEKRRYGKGAGREGMRPTFIVPWKARNVLIEGITLKESPMWNVHPVYSENIIVRGITVHSLESPNGDGVVPDSCKNVLIEYNHLETGDDAVVIKSGLNEDGLKIGIPSENIVVRNFTARDVRTGSGGIVFGSETSGGIRNVYVHDAYFDGCDRGIRFKTTRGRGNVIENIHIANVEMKNIENQAINFNSYYERQATGKSPLFRNIYISHVRVSGARTAIEMIGLPEKWLENINIENALFENVQNGAIAHRVKELNLDDVSITSSGRPIALEDVLEATIENVNLSGQRPLLSVAGSESGQIRVQGLTRDDVECAPHVPRAAVDISGTRLP